MSQHHFGPHDGHYDSPRDRRAVETIEREYFDVEHTDYTEPRGGKRGWWSCRNRGEPFNRETAAAVLARFRALTGRD